MCATTTPATLAKLALGMPALGSSVGADLARQSRLGVRSSAMTTSRLA